MNNDISNLINDFLRYKREFENRRPGTCRGYKHDLVDQLLPFLYKRNKTDISELIVEDIENYLVFIFSRSKTGSVSNRNRKLRSIRSFLNFLENRDIAFDRNLKNIKGIKNNKKTITYLNEEEQEKLLLTVEVSGTDFYKTRDIAILKLFLSTGIRVSELTNLKVKDVEIHSNGSSYIYISRKGGNEAQLPINSKAVSAIKAHLARRNKDETSPYLFLSRNNKQLEPNAVYYLVKHYLRKAGIEKRKWGPHILRHTVGVSLRRRGIDIATIQALFGHQKIETTSIYLNVESQDLARAVQAL